MSQYPVHVFVAPDGTWCGADQTDQAHMSLERAKRVRTRTIRRPGCVEQIDGDLIDIDGPEQVTILVSAGLWAPSQFGFAPFARAVKDAAAEATRLTDRGYTWIAADPWMTRSECAQVQTLCRVRSPIMWRALWLVAVKGYSKTGALRVLGHPDPERNGHRQLSRLVKSARTRLMELRCSTAASG